MSPLATSSCAIRAKVECVAVGSPAATVACKDDSSFSGARIKRDFHYVERAARFYVENPSNFVLPRSESGIFDRMSGGNFHQICIEKLDGTPVYDGQGTNIAAACMSFEFVIPERRGADIVCQPFVELGSMTSRLEGFRFQQIGHAVRILKEILHGEKRKIIAAVYSMNAPSLHNLKNNLHYVERGVCDEFFALREHYLQCHNQPSKGFVVLRPTIETINKSAAIIVSLLRNARQVRGLSTRGCPNVTEIEFCFGSGFPESFFTLARMIDCVKPSSLIALSDLLYNDEFYLPHDYLERS